MATKKKPKITANEVRKDLIDQLECAGFVSAQYVGLVEDYIRYFEIKQELQGDIKKRGAKVEKYDSRGQQQIANNESIDQLHKVVATMLKILDSLNIRGDVAGADEDAL